MAQNELLNVDAFLANNECSIDGAYYDAENRELQFTPGFLFGKISIDLGTESRRICRDHLYELYKGTSTLKDCQEPDAHPKWGERGMPSDKLLPEPTGQHIFLDLSVVQDVITWASKAGAESVRMQYCAGRIPAMRFSAWKGPEQLGVFSVAALPPPPSVANEEYPATNEKPRVTAEPEPEKRPVRAPKVTKSEVAPASEADVHLKRSAAQIGRFMATIAAEPSACEVQKKIKTLDKFIKAKPDDVRVALIQRLGYEDFLAKQTSRF